MSMNHFSSETLWWTTQQQQHPSPMEPSPNISPLYRHHHPPPSTATATFNFNLNHDEDGDQESCLQDKEELPKEPMFEKPLTPSDVGKLNRLVIPKQHAEKHFPLGGDSVDKGLLLSFEDELGKSWRFRYSYWNSSQSYVLTKGWSRFVKEKRLDAGDVVLFERHRMDGERFFIGWRRRAVAVPAHENGGLVAPGSIPVGGGGGWTRVFYNAQAYPAHPGSGGGGVRNGPGFPYQPDCLHAGSNVHNNNNNNNNNNNKRPKTPSGKEGRRSVRLFGVNLECGADDYEPDGSTTSSISSQGQGEAPPHYQYFSTSNHQHQQHHMDMNMCRDVNQMRYQHQYQQYHQG